MPSHDDSLDDLPEQAEPAAAKRARAPARAPGRDGRVLGQPGFVLHSYP